MHFGVRGGRAEQLCRHGWGSYPPNGPPRRGPYTVFDGALGARTAGYTHVPLQHEWRQRQTHGRCGHADLLLLVADAAAAASGI